MKRRKFLTSTLVASASGTMGNQFDLKTNPKPFVLKKSESRFGEKTKISGGSPNDIKVSSKDTDGQLTVFEYSGVTKGGPPLHIHPNQDEIFYVLEGNFLFQVGDEKHNLSVGETIFLSRNVPHAFAQITERGKMLYFFTPSGKMEDYFRVLGDLKGMPTPEEGAKIFANHDMKVVGPPLSF